MTAETRRSEPRPRLEVTAAGFGAVLAILSIFGLLACLCLRYTIDVPVQDQWSLVEDLGKYQEGSWTLADVARSHNGHRIALPRLIWVPLAFVTHWRQRPEIALNLLAGLGIFALLLRGCVKDGRELLGERGALLAVAFAILSFSFAQWENWQWGIQLQMFLGVLLVLLALQLLCRGSESALGLAAAALAGFLASFTQSAGLAVWPAGFVAILVANAGSARLRRAALWGVATLLTAALYLVPLPGDSGSGAVPGFLLEHPFQAARFLLSVLGRPASTFAGSPSPPEPTLVAPLLGLGLLVFLAHWARLHLADALSARDQRVAFWLASATFSVSVAALITLGRSFLGPSAALASRYTTLMLPLWGAAIYLASLRGFPQLGTTPLVRDRALLVIMLLCLLASSLREVPQLADRYYVMQPARDALMRGGPPDLLARLHPEVQQVTKGMGRLQQLELSVFRPSRGRRDVASGEVLRSFAQEIQVRTTLPEKIAPGGVLGLLVNVRNTGAEEWPSPRRSVHPVNLSYRWFDAASGAAVVVDGKRAELGDPLGAGQASDLQILVEAPDTAGRYLLRLSMVQEDVAWFMDRGAPGWEAALDVAP